MEKDLIKIALLTTDNREPNCEYQNPHPYFGTSREALLQGFAGLKEIEVHVISCARQPMQSPAKLADNVWFHSLFVPKLGWMCTLYWGCIRAVRKKLREIHPDIVHGQGTERDCAISAIFSGFPNVITIRGNIRLIARVNRAKPFSFYWLAARLEALTIPRSSGVVCLTQHTLRAVSDLAKRTWVISNAVNPAFYEVQRRSAPARTILCVGDVVPHKNQNALIRSLDTLANGNDFKVMFLGQAGKEQPYSAEFFNLLATRPWCVYGGFASLEQLMEHLETATLLVLPSLEDNCPMVILEAMAAGVPVLGARVGGIPELIEEGITGLLFDPLDPISMRDGMVKMLNEPAATEAMAQTAKQRALERFRPLVIARRHAEIYRKVLSRAT
jgi:glycosyltransferase involved in cell wall biosynthesis